MGIQTSMGAHKLEVAKGDRNFVVDHTAPLDVTDPVNVAAAVAGRVMTLTASGTFVAGVDVGLMPFYAVSGTDINNYPDVQRDRGMPYAGEARFGCISWRSPNELTSTEMIDDTYVVGDPLTAKAINSSDPTEAGLLCNLNASTDLIVGYVAPRGLYVGPDGYNTLAFYPAYVPGTTVNDV